MYIPDVGNEKTPSEGCRPIGLAAWEFRTNDFLLGESIGKVGCIEVRKGLLQKSSHNVDTSVTLVTGRSAEAKVTVQELMRQCRMMRELHHPCVLKFYGACLISQPCCFLMEHIAEGPLDEFLSKSHGTLKRDELLQMVM
ncbi:unnamed protein product, partial [Heligmosomoides polygyrus]|uniref:Pkinase_Tyr domain-containing protein n=1 Tax=Heligmosomoides polygyrus TaxID=6339 RepID=A0A183FBB6_HELPZ